MVVLYVLLALLALFALTLACLALFTAYTAWQVERLLPSAGRFLDIDGARIHYLDLGEGPPIVFIHGLAGQLQHFTYALTGRLVSGHRLIVFDRPGSGYSVPRPAGTAGIRAQAAILAKAIEMLKLDKPLIVGHSLGGAVSLAIAQDYPKLAGGLALIAPLTHPVAAPPEAFKAMEIRPAFLRWLISWTLAVPMTIRATERLLALVFAPEKGPDDFGTKAGGLLGLRPCAFRAASEDLLAAPRDLPGLVRRYSEIGIPVRVLYGTKDAVLNCKVHGLPMEAAIPHSHLQLLEHRGHMLPLTAPGETAKFVLQTEQAIERVRS
jgi:pimeloyl-ACP methyl ester carboxylesterase